MAIYLGKYESDTAKTFDCVELSVVFVEVTIGEIRGTFALSNADEDQRYIPPIFFSQVALRERRQQSCTLPHTPRYALLWLTDTLYLRVPLPFRPGSTEYNQFFISLAFDFSEQFVTIGQRGEQVSSNWLKLYTR